MHFKDVIHVLRNLNEEYREDSEQSSPMNITFFANDYAQLGPAIGIAKSMGMNVTINATLNHAGEYFSDLKYAGADQFQIKVSTDCIDLAKLEEIAKCLPTTIVVQHSFQVSFLDFIKRIDKMSIKDVIISSNDATRLKCIMNVAGVTLARFPLLKEQVEGLTRSSQLFGLKNSSCKKCNYARNNLTIVELEVYPCMEYYRNKGNKIGMYFGANTGDHIESWYKETNVLDNLICKNGCRCFSRKFNEEIG
jgi:hypothetical protein